MKANNVNWMARVAAMAVCLVSAGARGATFGDAWGAWSSAESPALAMAESAESWEELLRGAWGARDAWVRCGERTDVPPGAVAMTLYLGAVAVPAEMIPAGAATERECGVEVWRLRVRETEKSGSRAFEATVGGVAVPAGLPAVPVYDGTAWTEWVYGVAPGWLSVAGRKEWLADRARDRIGWSATLVPSASWGTYAANRVADGMGAEGVVLEGALPGIGGTGARLSVRGGRNGGAARVLETENLTSGGWTYRGMVLQRGGTGTADVGGGDGRMEFWTAEEADSDSDGDGIPDAVERHVLGTSPAMQDTSGDGLDDWEKAYRYGLDPMTADSSGDGISDAERVASGADPQKAATAAEVSAASQSIRYVYDEDDRLVGTWFGAGETGGGSTTRLTPAGNPGEVHHLGAGE